MHEHIFRHSDKRGYAQCDFCKSYRSTQFVDPLELYTPDYWTHAQGHSTLDEQVWNCDIHKEGGKSKYEFVLDRIHTERGTALEIGCAPGRLLQLLKGIGRFQRVVGIEACPEYEDAIRRIGCFGGELLFGFFPFCTDGLGPASVDLIIGLDVFEHAPEPEEFLQECRRLLKPDAQLMLMLPLLRDDLEERFFLPSEHIWIFSEACLRGMLAASGFGEVKLSRWANGHELINARKSCDGL